MCEQGDSHEVKVHGYSAMLAASLVRLCRYHSRLSKILEEEKGGRKGSHTMFPSLLTKLATKVGRGGEKM